MRALRWTLAAAVALGAAWISFDLLREAYGAGPPYYGQTTNMDKWTSPWPSLAMIDGPALLVIFALLTLPRRKRR